MRERQHSLGATEQSLNPGMGGEEDCLEEVMWSGHSAAGGEEMVWHQIGLARWVE